MNKQNKHLTGFTIIELIVAIAIIAVLAAIIMVNIGDLKNKSKDSITKDSMSKLYLLGNDWLQEHDSYGHFFEEQGSKQKEVCDSVEAGPKKKYCHDNETSFAMCVKLKSDIYWCADYTGANKQIDAKDCEESIQFCPEFSGGGCPGQQTDPYYECSGEYCAPISGCGISHCERDTDCSGGGKGKK